MTTTLYERRVFCDNCGRWVTQARVDSTAFHRQVEQTDPDEDDLFEEEQERALQVVVTHVPLCRHCQDTT